MRNQTIACAFLLLATGSSFAAPDAGMAQKALAGSGDRFIELPRASGGASYVASSSAQTMRFDETGIRIAPRYAKSTGTSASSLQYQFAGARQVAPVTTSAASGIVYNWLVGSQSNWARGLKSYSQIAYRGLWPGIDATYSGDVRGMKYHFDVAPGVDPATIRMIVSGASDARIASDGAIEWTVGGRLVRDEAPIAYQGAAGSETIVPAAFQLEAIDASTWSVSISTSPHDASKSLTVDPAWTAFAGLVGGNSADQVYGVAIDSQGNTYACGITASPNLPSVGTQFDGTSDGDSDAFIVKFSPTGTPLYVTYFGGNGYDVCTGIAVHTDGTIYVTGGTQSSDFPAALPAGSDGALRQKATTDRDAFVAKFAPSGSTLVFSGVIGGTRDDQSNGIALDALGDAYITGYSDSTLGFPIRFLGTPNGGIDAFVTHISSDGRTVPMSGFIGGSGDDVAHAIAVSQGNIYVVGETNSTAGLPAIGGQRTLTSAGGDAFVAKINSSTNTMTWFALLSGGTDVSSPAPTHTDRALAVAVDPADSSLLITGETDSDNFPADDSGTRLVSGGAQSVRRGGMDGFLVRMDPNTVNVLGATYLGGATFDTAEAVAADGQGGYYVAGTVAATSALSFPIASTNGVATTPLGGQDGFIAKLTGTSALSFAYSGFVGSNVNGASVDDAMHAIAATPGSESVLAVGGATTADASGFTSAIPGALNPGGTNGVAIRITPYHTPLSMSVVSGSPQDVTITSAFGAPLKLKVTDADGAAVLGIAVTYTAPATGASANLSGSVVTTDISGVAQVTATANGIPGSYTVNVAANVSGIPLSTSFSLTNDKLPQSISFGTLPDRTFGDAPFTISATADSGLAVSFSSLTTSVCTISGNTVTIVAGGGCTIQADQGGDATHLAAASVQQAFNVAPESQTVSFTPVGAQTFVAGATFGLNATATSGLAVTFSTSSATCSVLASTVTMLSTGTCTILASQSGNASFASATASQDVGMRAAPGHTGDFDGTGDADLLWQNADGRAAIWLMNGLTTTSSAEILPAGTGFHVVQAADLDGDGKTDLVWAHPDGRVVVWIMDGFSHGAKATLVPAASGWSVVAAADLDGDGKADLVWQNTDGSVAVWTMDGVTRTGGATILGPGTGWSVTRAADFDGDGKADLLFTNTDGRVAIWLMNGTTVRSTTEIMPAASGWSVVATPDLNGDGRADIVWRNTDGSVNAWLMNGASTLAAAPILAAGTPWSVALAGDFDGDGMDDLLFTQADGSAAIYLMNGTTPKQTTQVLGAGGNWTPVKLRDLNGDGKLDIVWQNSDGRVAAYLMNGTTVSAGADLLGAGTGWSITPAGP